MDVKADRVEYARYSSDLPTANISQIDKSDPSLTFNIVDLQMFIWGDARMNNKMFCGKIKTWLNVE